MKGKKYISVIIMCLACLVTRSQDFHFSGFQNNMIFINPACAALPVAPEFMCTYRNQWPGISATFTTYGAAFVFPVKTLDSGLGVHVLNDIQGNGVLARTYASLLYGYQVDLGRDWKLGAGISAAYVFRQFDTDELIFKTDLLNDLGYSYSNVTLDDHNNSYPDFGIGMVLQNGNGLCTGVSVNHITRPEESSGNQVENRIPVKYAGFITKRINTNPGATLIFEPGIYYSRQDKHEELIWGVQSVFSSSFLVGGWIRQDLKFQYDAVIFSLGILKGKYNFFYTYDVNLKKINFLSTKMGAHEVTFLYRMEYKGRKAGAVECPTYSMINK